MILVVYSNLLLDNGILQTDNQVQKFVLLDIFMNSLKMIWTEEINLSTL